MPGVTWYVAVMRVLLACLVIACSGKSLPRAKDDAAPKDTAAFEVSARALGLPDLASWGWRARGGHGAFRAAREAEARGDWAEVVKTCTQALAADPLHLDAAWLLAVGHAKLGKLDSVIGPLQVAAAGDFGKWGPASLELPGLQPFLATPVGQAWRRRVEEDAALYTQALARSTIVFADGDLFAWDPEASRWYRLTRTNGAVVGAIRFSATRVAYVARQRDAKDDKATQLGIGLVDLARGKSSRPVGLDTKGPVAVANSTKTNPGVWIGSGKHKATTWRRFDDDFRLTALPPKTTRPSGPWLEVRRRTSRLNTLPIAGIAADWDDQGLASAIRVAKSNRVVSVPSPGLIAGSSIVWSPDRARLAFVALLDDQCPAVVPDAGAVPDAAAFVADATTGALQEVERAAHGLAIEWRDDRKLVIAGDNGVRLVDLDGAPPVTIDGAENLVTPRLQPKCTMPEPAEPDEPPPEEEPEVAPTDAGVPPSGGRG